MGDDVLDALLERSRAQAGGLRLTGKGSLFGELVKAVLERALEAELTAPWDGVQDGQTGVGPVPLQVPGALLGCAFPRYAGAALRCPAGSGGEAEVVVCDAEPVTAGDFGGDLVMGRGAGSARRHVLRQGSALGGGASPAHRPQPCLQPPVIRLDRVVRMPLNDMRG
jgi:hypothetical protein